MNNKIRGVSLVVLTLVMSTACTPRKSKTVITTSGPYSSCVAEASALTKIDRAKYAKDYNNLAAMIRITKDYSGDISNIRNDTQSIVTPLYQYKMNNICNEISQKLLAEMKDKALGIQSQ